MHLQPDAPPTDHPPTPDASQPFNVDAVLTQPRETVLYFEDDWCAEVEILSDDSDGEWERYRLRVVRTLVESRLYSAVPDGTVFTPSAVKGQPFRVFRLVRGDEATLLLDELSHEEEEEELEAPGFTPGPWEWLGSDEPSEGYYVTGPDHDAPVICDIVARGGETVHAMRGDDLEPTYRQRYTDEDQANARLIAAAPALYEALHEVIEALSDSPDWHPSPRVDDESWSEDAHLSFSLTIRDARQIKAALLAAGHPGWGAVRPSEELEEEEEEAHVAANRGFESDYDFEWGDHEEYTVYWRGAVDEDWSGRRVYYAEVTGVVHMETDRVVDVDEQGQETDWWREHGAAVQEAADEIANDY